MSIWQKLRGELIDIVEWMDDSHDTLVHRFRRHENEIKYGAKLVVREGQSAVFVNMGQTADVFGPGMYTLETKNLPILSTLLGWKYGFSSPFKAEVYFVSTRQFTDLKWGTMNPIMLRDPEFGPVRLRAYGTYAMKATDPEALIKEIVGTNGHFRVDGITNQLRNVIVSRFTDILGESRIPILDLAANYDELGEFISNRIMPEFAGYGLDLMKLLVENISLPPAVEEALDKRSSMGVIGDLRKYTQFQTAEAMRDAARNEGGMAGGGMGMGMGFAMANQMAHAMMPQQNGGGAGGATGMGGAAGPPPLPGAVAYHAAIDGAAAGPFDMATLRVKIGTGEITGDTLVWNPTMPGWAKASQRDDLAPLFATSPPPLPPQ
jgi:membrane protease subunit (stomatin/prohibitin family)